MADIPLSLFVSVSLSTTPVPPSQRGFGTFLVITEETGVIGDDEIRTYSSMDEVTTDWTGKPKVLAAATAFFSQAPRPTSFAVGFRDPVAEPDVTTSLARLANLASWYAFGFTDEVRDNQDAKDAAAWTETQEREFFTVSNDVGSLVTGDQGDIGYHLNAQGYTRTLWVYSSTAAEYPEVSAFGRAASVDFDGSDTTITLKYKDLPGITPEAVNSNQLGILAEKGGNVLVAVAGSRIFTEGTMAKGSGVYQDTIHGLDWLKAEIETRVFSVLVQTRKVPYTDKGVAVLQQATNDSLDQGVRNGYLAPGETNDGVFLPLGYLTEAGKVADASASNRSARNAPPIQFVAIEGGAIHRATIIGIVEA